MAKGSVKLSIYSTFKDDGTKQAERALQAFAKKAGQYDKKTGAVTLDDQTAALARQSVEWDRLAGKMGAASKKLDAVAQAFAPFSAAAAAALGSSVKLAADYESGMAKVATITDKTQMDVGEMGAQLLDLSNDTGRAVTELTEAAYQAQSASVETSKTVGFVGQSVNLAKAGFTETSTAVDTLTTIINAYKMSADDAAAISDKLVQTQNKGKTTVGELASSLGSAIPTAAAYNVSLDNLLTGYVELTKQGIDTANATTYLNGMMTELADTGSTVSQTLVQQTGKSFSELMADGASLGDVMAVLRDSVDGDSTAFANLWGNVRASKGALAIANAGAGEFNAQLDAMANSSGTVAAALADLDTSSAKANRAVNSLKNTGVLLGQEFLGALQPALVAAKEAAGGLYEGVRDADEGTKQLAVSTLAGAAALAPMFKGASLAAGGVGDLAGKMGKASAKLAEFSAGGGKAARVAGVLGSALSGPAVAAFAVLAVGVAASAKGIADYRRKMDDADKATRGLAEACQAASPTVKDAAGDMSELGASAGRARVDIDELTESQARLADEVRERNDAAQASINRLQGARDVIDQYANATDLTAQQQGRLRDAVALVNRECGTQYEVVDAANGAIRDEQGALIDTTAAIDDYIAKKQEQVRVEALSESLSGLYEQKAADIAGVASAQDEYNAKLEAWRAAEALGGEAAQSAAEDLDVAKASLEQARSNLDATNRSISSVETQMGALSEAADGAAMSVGDLAMTKLEITATLPDDQLQAFRGQLESTGITTERFRQLTDEQLMQVAQRYDGSTASIIASLQSFGVECGSAGQQAGYNFGAGMAGGISGWIGEVSSRAAEMVRQAKAAADREADSHSPSREMAKRGRWFAQGFAGGIDREVPTVVDASRGMVSAAMATAQVPSGGTAAPRSGDTYIIERVTFNDQDVMGMTVLDMLSALRRKGAVV